MSSQTNISRRHFLAFGVAAVALVGSGAATAQSLGPTQPGPYGLPLQGPFNPPPPGVVQSQPNGYQSSPDQAAARQQVSDAIRDQLGKVGQLQGNTLAVHFSISSASSPPPSYGFTSPVPFNSVAPPPEGVMVMELSPPEALIDRFSVSASMSVMSAQYSDANGARHPVPMGMPHFLQWSGTIEGGQLSLQTTTDANRNTTEFVASVFNVSPASVTLSMPSPSDIPQAEPPRPPCGPVRLPNGMITGRACYN